MQLFISKTYHFHQDICQSQPMSQSNERSQGHGVIPLVQNIPGELLKLPVYSYYSTTAPHMQSCACSLYRTAPHHHFDAHLRLLVKFGSTHGDAALPPCITY